MYSCLGHVTPTCYGAFARDGGGPVSHSHRLGGELLVGDLCTHWRCRTTALFIWTGGLGTWSRVQTCGERVKQSRAWSDIVTIIILSLPLAVCACAGVPIKKQRLIFYSYLHQACLPNTHQSSCFNGIHDYSDPAVIRKLITAQINPRRHQRQPL